MGCRIVVVSKAVLADQIPDDWHLTTAPMDIADWRKRIDEIDQKLVELISHRAQAAHEIGRLKRDAGMPIYEPDRERAVFEHVTKVNPGPLPGQDMMRIYERIMDVMRQIQQEEIAPESLATGTSSAAGASTEVDPEVDD